MDFISVILEGVFYRKTSSNDVWVADQVKGDVCVLDELSPMEGRLIQASMHHKPQNPIQPRWGGGCCLWQPSPCPAGHHEDPSYLLNVMGRGVLEIGQGGYCLLQADYGDIDLPLHLMDGHYGLLVAVTIIDSDPVGDSDQDVEKAQSALVDQILSIQKMVAKIRGS